MRVRTGGAWKETSGGLVRVGGSFQPLTEVRAYIGGAWKTIASFVSPLTATATPTSVSAIRTGAGYVTSDPTTATPDGGKGPYTYSWARVGAGSGVINSATSASTTFSRTMAADETATETYRCTVTDSQDATATCDVSAVFASVSSDIN